MPPVLRRLALAMVLAVVLVTVLIGPGAAPAAAAEVLQVRSAGVLLVGDSNRTYTVELACVSSSPDQQPLALDWLRGQLPRRSRVNLRPLGNRDGVLVARVQKLGSASDLSSAMVEAGLAETAAAPGCA